MTGRAIQDERRGESRGTARHSDGDGDGSVLRFGDDGKSGAAHGDRRVFGV